MAKNKVEPQTAEIPEIYTNSANAVVTPYEILLQLGLETQGSIKPICNIRMSPQYPEEHLRHAKALSQMLTKTIAQYETQIGEINLGKKK